MIWTEPASHADYFAFMGGQNANAWVMKRDGEPIAMAGVIDRFGDGEFWAYLNTRGYLTPTELLLAVKAMRGFLQHNHDKTIKVQCSETRFPTSPRLLRRLGFQPTGDRLNGMEIWQWQQH